MAFQCVSYRLVCDQLAIFILTFRLFPDFVLSKITPTIHTALGWKMFVMFATINILGMGTFSFFLPETKGRSLEDMDIIFGTITAEERDADIKRANQSMFSPCFRDGT
jgi:hypothetical protein